MTRDLSRLLHPRSIAFIGGSECDVAVTRTREFGFTGKIWAVHPSREQLGGIPCVRSVDEIDGPVDAAFVAVKREPAIRIVRALRAKGGGGAVIYASGFAETGDTRLQEELVAAAKGMPLMGPNCYGYVNGLARVALWPDEHGIDPCSTGVAIVSQSGNMACNFTFTMRALPLACVFTIGNQADVDVAQMLENLARDDRITAIGLHIEGLRDISSFARAASIAREHRKPVIALKTGRSSHGAKVAMSHTASLAGSDALYNALFKRYGVARIKSVTAFVETLKFLHYGGAVADNRIVSMSCSGGEAALVADMALDKNLRFPPFNTETKSKVAATLNEYVTIDNPLDYHTFIWNQEDKLTATFSAVLGGGYDVSMLLLDTPTNPKTNPASWRAATKALMTAAERTGARAAIVASLPECMPPAVAAELGTRRIAPMMGLDDALTAFETAAFIGANWARTDAPPVLNAQAQRGSGEVTLGEYDAKQLLRSYGLAIPEGVLCKAEDAVNAAQRIGYPVTIKAASSSLVHKTEAGGVALNLRTPDEVKDAVQRMRRLAPDVLVERMITNAVAEFIVGLTSDTQFGTAVVMGAGGVLTELIGDSVALILPTSRAEIERALKTLKVWKLIEGFRGRSGDQAALIKAVEAIAAFAEAHRGLIVELDVNPLLVLPDGAVAVDALIKMRNP